MSVLEFACCFCGEGIKSTDIDPCIITVITDMKRYDEEEIYSQDFFCHKNCFQKNLHDKARMWSWPTSIESFSHEDRKLLINKILDLKDVNYWQLLQHGLREGIIDNNFVINFAEEVLSQGVSDNFALQLAGILKSQSAEVSKFLKNYLKEADKNFEEEIWYNRIWLDLILRDKNLVRQKH